LKASGLILSVNKPRGWSSFAVVNKLRRALKWKSVGHAGTLDPAADGVLIVLFGDATKRCDEFMDLPKEYVAGIRFGVTTETDDLDGVVTQACDIADWSETRIANALKNFVGVIEQTPPAVSAIKIRGRRSYQLARAGKPELAPPRKIQIYSLRILEIRRPEIRVAVSCSRGTYVRSLARDLGAMMGWGGALSSLTRTAVGPYRVEQAFIVSDLVRCCPEFVFE